MKLIKIILTTSLLFSSISADDIETRFNYFGNIMASKLTQDGYSIRNYNNDDVNSKASFNPYSKLGGQITAFKDKYTFTGQALVHKNHDKYESELTWLNLKYDINSDLTLRAGRIQTTLLLSSDSLNIDYIQLWAKAPDEVYRIMAIKSYDGAEIIYKDSYNDYEYTLTLTPHAEMDTKINTDHNTTTDAILTKARAIKFQVEKDNIVLQGSYTKANLDLPESNAFDGIVQALAAVNGNDMYRYSYRKKDFSVITLGLNYKYDNFLFNSEVARIEIQSLLPDMTTYYLMAGYKFDKLTPFIIYAQNLNDKEHFDTSDVKTNSATTAAQKEMLNDILYSTNTSQTTSSIGFRYDYKPGIAVKGQVDRITTSNYGSTSQSTVNLLGYERQGILARDAGTDDKAIYAITLGVNFAF